MMLEIYKGHKVYKDLKAMLARKVLKDLKAIRVIREQLVQKVHRQVHFLFGDRE